MGILSRYYGSPIAAALLAVALLAPFPAAAQANGSMQLQEHKIKAGLIYNFLKYTHRIGDIEIGKEGRVRVCLMGGDPFDGYLYPLEGRTAQKQPIEVTPLRYLNEAGPCSVVVIHRRLESRLPDILRDLKRYNVLTVSDINGFSRRGGMVEMATGGDRRIHLYINNRAVEAAGLGIQDRLLKLAELVE